ncbi:hypothetical protein SS50377_27945 [Spironucleus salmonicida]|uniref:NGG1p interacting factor NIF3 n=1 Tax=Spironucleus salmonicida TaxID=348837 RepID=V6LDE8_9EUKA|nr:hypothetical protein SS50377_27945 [Spironucleus salmonicida]|eukprot:EST42507.1 hypothetical protein SS50377_17813 [Spironucleus salmonicida]
MYRLDIYIPDQHVELVKKAIFDAGAGKFGNYDSCCFQVHGKGQFRALGNADPFLGKQDVLEIVDEVQLQCIVQKQYIHEVLAALHTVHPYEEPAYQFWRVNEF